MQEETVALLDFLAQKIDAAGNKDKLSKIIRILFQAEDQHKLLNHFKFDISFPLSGNKYSQFRFTYNDYNEKKRLRAEAIRIFSLFGKSFDLAILKRLLGLSRLPLTFGIDWKSGEKIPDIKLYFETNDIEGKLLKGISGISGIDYQGIKAYLTDRVRLAAIGISFLKEKKYQLKIYYYSESKMNLNNLESKQLKEITRFRKLLTLDRNGFYLHCITFQDEMLRHRDKHYKIYSTEGYLRQNRLDGLLQAREREINALTKEVRVDKYYRALNEDLNAIAKRYNALAFPIAISTDLDIENTGFPLLGIYFSIIQSDLCRR